MRKAAGERAGSFKNGRTMSAAEGKKVSESRLTMLHRPLPDESNAVGKMYGGHILRHLDGVGSMCAFRHARCPLVTASVDRMQFFAPISLGDIVLFHASVNMVGTSSMEVGIRIETEELFSGEVRHAGTAYMTFVAMDEQGRPRKLPALVPETEDDLRRMSDASRRMTLRRLERRNTGVNAAVKSTHVPFSVLPGNYAICRLSPGSDLPRVPAGQLFSMTRTPEELSLIVSEAESMGQVDFGSDAKIERGYCCFKVEGPLEFDMVGILAGFTTLFAAAGIPVFAMSTFDTDYILMKAEYKEDALAILLSSGYTML